MKVDVLLGLQWGDEGKGKIVDVLTPKYDIIGRFQGGPNAGHTLEFNGIKHVLHTIPSGIFHPKAVNIIGNGVVIDPVVFKKEIDALLKLGVDVKSKLIISKRAHLILPTHRLLDAASETSKGKEKIGSTLKGIGPTYMDKTGRNGLRVGDIDADRMRVHVRDAKGNRDRLVPLPANALAVLREFWKVHRNPALLFPSRQKGLGGAAAATVHMDRGGVQQALRQVTADIGLKKELRRIA